MMTSQKSPPIALKPSLTFWFALGFVLISYLGARDPRISANERGHMASRFRLSQHPIADVGKYAPREMISTREVRPELQRNLSWNAATGAAVTLADLDRDGLSNDMLLVDPRLNTVLIRAVPGTGERFSPFTLDPVDLQWEYSPRTMSPTGSLVGDFNEDGADDILVHYWGRPPVIFQSQPFGKSGGGNEESLREYRAIELAVDAANRRETWFTHAGSMADIDGDGHLDLLFGNFYQNEADVLNAGSTQPKNVMHAGKSKAGNGGGAKLFLWTPPDQRPEPSRIFRDVSHVLEQHCGKGWVLAIGAADLDPESTSHQGLPEIYVAHDFGPDRLLYNLSTPGNPQFRLCKGERFLSTPKSFVLGMDSYKGMGLDFADINADGLFDIYVSNISDDLALHEGHFVFVHTGDTAKFKEGIAPFEQRSSRLGLVRSGWGWDCRFVDFDNDGVPESIQGTGFAKGKTDRWPEVHALGTTNDQLISNPDLWPRLRPPDADLSGDNVNPFFVRSENGRYFDIAADLGMGQPWNTRGLAVADVDGDGWLDFVAANQWEASVYVHNDSSSETPSKANSFVGLHLILPHESSDLKQVRVHKGHPNGSINGRPAIGATATIALSANRRTIAQVDGGTGHSGKRAQEIHFGLGANPPELVAVDLSWRDRVGNLQKEVVRVAPGNWYTVELGKRGL